MFGYWPVCKILIDSKQFCIFLRQQFVKHLSWSAPMTINTLVVYVCKLYQCTTLCFLCPEDTNIHRLANISWVLEAPIQYKLHFKKIHCHIGFRIILHIYHRVCKSAPLFQNSWIIHSIRIENSEVQHSLKMWQIL